MSSGGSSTSRDKDEYGHGYKYTTPSNEQSTHEGMTTQPSVGRFTENEKATTMFSRKPALGTTAPKAYEGQPWTPQSNHGTHFQDSSSQSTSSGIVNLKAGPRAEGRMNKSASKGKK